MFAMTCRTVSMTLVLTSGLALPVTQAALAENAPAGTCVFFTEGNYGGQAAQIVGGDVVLFYAKGRGPDTLAGYENLRVFHDATWQDKLSSVRVASGCTAGWAMGNGPNWSYTESTTDDPQFSPNTDDQADAAYCFCQ